MSTVQATGRRKQAIARVRLTPGSGQITANGREFDDYFPSAVHRTLITEPLLETVHSFAPKAYLQEPKLEPANAAAVMACKVLD